MAKYGSCRRSPPCRPQTSRCPAPGKAAATAAPSPHGSSLCCALVFAMVVVGGVTRLTHSGLSIVEWQPIVGTLPPLSDADWQQTFEKYQQTPQYRQVNQAMTLAEFKGIFWWEYVHRLLGRADRRRLSRSAACGSPCGARFRRATRGSSLGIFVLGGLQGAMGWYMVKSGLVDDPRVSQFRLTAHLGSRARDLRGDVLGRAIARRFRSVRRCRRPRSARRDAGRSAVAALVFVMIAHRRLRRRHPRRASPTTRFR